MDKLGTSIDAKAATYNVVNDNDEEALDEILRSDIITKLIDISGVLANIISAWHQLVLSAALSIPVYILDTGIYSDLNNTFELQQIVGQEEATSIYVSQQEPPSPGLVTQPARISENRRLQARPTAQTGRILS